VIRQVSLELAVFDLLARCGDGLAARWRRVTDLDGDAPVRSSGGMDGEPMPASEV